MAVLAVQQTSPNSGLAPVFGAAAVGGDTFNNNGNSYLHFKNPTGAAITVTIDSIQQCSQGFDHDTVVAIPAAGERIIGPLSMDRFGANPAITYSAVGLTVAVVQRP